jgi:hypothetical protein
MKSSTRNAPPGQVPVGQVAGEAPPAGNARRTALIDQLADLASSIAQIVVAILGYLPI